eukprot:2698932-Rhodomonas_salina.1
MTRYLTTGPRTAASMLPYPTSGHRKAARMIRYLCTGHRTAASMISYLTTHIAQQMPRADDISLPQADIARQPGRHAFSLRGTA